MRYSIIALAVITLSGCATPPEKRIDDLCALAYYHPLKDQRRAAQRELHTHGIYWKKPDCYVRASKINHDDFKNLAVLEMNKNKPASLIKAPENDPE